MIITGVNVQTNNLEMLVSSVFNICSNPENKAAGFKVKKTAFSFEMKLEKY